MAKSPTNLSLDEDTKKEAQILFSDLGMDLSTAVNVFLKQSVRVQGFPFIIERNNPNAETAAALNEYYEMKAHPEKYKKYSSFKDALKDTFNEA